ncbi:MAG: Uma2 family endonuclease [Synechocystis sp.]|jgi:Uma2 family endonuclease
MSPLVESPPCLYSPAEYLALEEKAEFKSEYRDGEIIPMTGGSITHNYIAGNLLVWLKTSLRGKGGKIYINDVKVWIPAHIITVIPIPIFW